MRYAAYFVAVLAVAGVVYVISQPETESPAPQAAVSAAAEADRAATGEAAGAEKLVTMSVPEMHCPFACYPAVKKTLEQQPGVLAVDLVEQKKEGVIDRREVKVKVAEDFDANSAIASLNEAGFEKSSVIQ